MLRQHHSGDGRITRAHRLMDGGSIPPSSTTYCARAAVCAVVKAPCRKFDARRLGSFYKMVQLARASDSRRVDIQQLRAIAVIVVILNHLASNTFTGGYLGVDAFFVISGYVITRSIVNQPRPSRSRARFFVEFWVRRVYRLWPALFVVVCATSLITRLLDVATPSTMLTGIASLVSLSNVRLYFGLQDYFALNTNADWFMHTWSLSVEEQFYLVISILFMAIGLHRVAGRSSHNRRTITIGLTITFLLAAASLALSLLPDISEIHRFYLPVTRFYQLAAGVLVALSECFRSTSGSDAVNCDNSSRRTTIRRTAATIAVIALVASMTWEIAAPRWSSMIVTGIVTTAILTAPSSVHRSGYFPGRSLTWVGDRSYALYLVHWPIQMTTDLLIVNTWVQIAASITGTVIFGEALHHLVENRYRLSYQSMSLPRSFILAAVVLISVLFANVAFFNQLDRRAQAVSVPDQGDRCTLAWAADDSARAASLISQTWVLGDSHSEAIEATLARVLKNDCVVIARLGPFILYQRIGQVNDTQRAIRVNLGKPDDLISWISSAVPPPKSLIVSHYLTAYVGNPSTAPLSSDMVAIEWLDSSGEVITRERFISRFAENLGRVADALAVVGGNLIVTSPPPDFNWLSTPLEDVNCDSQLFLPRACITLKTEATISLADHRERRRDVVFLLNSVAENRANVAHIDLSAPFCDETLCSNFRDGAALYIDDDHLNYRGRRLVEPLLQEWLPGLVARTARTGQFLRCTPNTSVFACDYVQVSDVGAANADTIDFRIATPEFPLVDSKSHTDSFGNVYCVRLFANGDGTFQPGTC